jgi:hypothetical protein
VRGLRSAFALGLVAVLLLTCSGGASAATTTPLMTEDFPAFVDGTGLPRETAFDEARYAGATQVRALVKRDAAFTWDQTDVFVDAARERGFAPYLTLTYRPPDWGPLGTAMALPRPQELAAFCGTAAARYRGRVHDYSVWNEPNGIAVNRLTGPAAPIPAATYGRLFRACASAIRTSDPDARVFFGELATGGNACAYLAGALSPTEPTIADGLAIHPYQFDLPPEQGYPDAPCKGIGHLDDWSAALRSAFASGTLATPAGTQLPLMVTEFGYCTADGECPKSTGAAHRLPAATRADWIARAYRVAQQHGATLFSYYHLVEHAESASADHLWDTGIVGADGAPTPSLVALHETLAAQTSAASLAQHAQAGLLLAVATVLAVVGTR